jgi:hypothetical protein
MLMRTPAAALSIDHEQILLNAYCIDFVHGGVYAWTYLATVGLREPQILAILCAPIETWCRDVDNIEDRANRALAQLGMQRYHFTVHGRLGTLS